MFENIVEEPRVPAPPCVDRLFNIADLKKGTRSRGVLNHLVDEIRDHFPLDEVRVLKFVEEPVVVAGIEAVINSKTVGIIRHLSQDRSATVFGSIATNRFVAGEQQLHILKGELPDSADAIRVD